VWWFVFTPTPAFMKTLILFTALFFCVAGNAQDSTGAKPQLKISVNYNSNLNYYGRTDSLKSSGLFPLLEFWATPEFYINAAPIFIFNQTVSGQYAGTVATIGYQHLTEKWLSSVYALKPFYKEESELVQALLKAQTGVSISRLTNVVNVTIGADAKFSNKVDFGAIAGLDRAFKIEANKNVVVINPSFYTYAGTQQFSKTYTKKKANGLPLPGNNQTVTETSNKFNVLAYEVSVPLILVSQKWMLSVTPSYILPQNLLVTPGQPQLSEKGEKTFYTTAALKYSF